MPSGEKIMPRSLSPELSRVVDERPSRTDAQRKIGNSAVRATFDKALPIQDSTAEEIKFLEEEVRHLFWSNYEGQKPYSPEGLADFWFQCFSNNAETADKVTDLLEKAVWGPDLARMDLTKESELKKAISRGFAEEQIVSRLLVGERRQYHSTGAPYYLQACGQRILPQLSFLRAANIHIDANDVADRLFINAVDDNDVNTLCDYGVKPDRIAKIIAESPKGSLYLLPVCDNLIEKGVHINPDQVKAEAQALYYKYPKDLSSFEKRRVEMARVVEEGGRRTLILMDRDGFKYTRYEKELASRGNFDGVKINFDVKLPTDILKGPNSINHCLSDFCSTKSYPSKWESSDDAGKIQIIKHTMGYFYDVLGLSRPVALELDKSLMERGWSRGASDRSATHTIGFSMAYKDDPPVEALDTIAHEMWHLFQWEHTTDPKNDLELIYARNNKYYCTTEEHGFDYYYDQPIEKEARAFAAQFRDYLPRLSAELNAQEKRKYFNKFRRIFSF